MPRCRRPRTAAASAQLDRNAAGAPELREILAAAWNGELARWAGGERAAGREEGSTEFACRFFILPMSPEDGMALARRMFGSTW